MKPLKPKPQLRPRIGTLLGGLVLMLLFFIGCGGRVTLDEDWSEAQIGPQLWPGDTDLTIDRPGCDLLAGETLPGGKFTFALTDSVDPRWAPVPRNSSERLVFAQLYETLVNVDCDGLVRPGLAEKWTCTEDSTVWVFTLRDEARLWDGTRITPGEVKDAWTRNQDCPRTRSSASPWFWFNARSSTVTILDARRLAVRLPEPQASFPLLLAHPATAVALPRLGWTWPVGSGPCRLRAATPAPLPNLECLPNPHHPRHPAWKSLTFIVHPGKDPRDFVGLAPDLLMVRRLDSLAFFQEAPGFTVQALPWDRLYLLVVSPEQNLRPPALWAEAASQLDPGRDLTTISARSWPDIIFPTGSAVDCPQLAGPVALGSSAQRSWDLASLQLAGDALVYRVDDLGATEIANRLGALASQSLRVVPLPADAATFVLDWQMVGAQILRLDQVFPTRCLQMATLLGKAAWIQKAGLGTGNQRGQQADSGVNSLVAAETRFAPPPADPLAALRGFIYPLALSRPSLVTRGDLAGLRLAFDGTPLLAGLGVRVTDSNLP